jgi:hypothetical protein
LTERVSVVRIILSNTAVLITAALIILVVSVIVDIFSQTFVFTYRAAGPIMFLGAIAAARPIVRQPVNQVVSDETSCGGGGADSEPFDESEKQTRLDAIGQVAGLICALIGMILGSYADLLVSAVL